MTRVIEMSSTTIDNYLPCYHFSEKHTIRINASPSEVFKTLKQFDTRLSRIIRILTYLRNGYGRIFSGSLPKHKIELGTIKELAAKTGFTQLAEFESHEILYGAAGRFWMPSGRFISFQTPTEFVNFNLPDYCKIVWNFYLTESSDGATILITETRVFCMGLAKLFFPPYWLVVRPFSSWIRLEMLRLVKEEAEKNRGAVREQ